MPSLRSLVLLTLWFIAGSLCAADAPRPWGNWLRWGDQGDGTYQNPVLPSDYSDLDCIRVGSDYYAISSTFQYSPGVVILHSRDLVNWTIAGHAVTDLTQISPELNWDRMNRYGKGIWAGAIRHHAGKFWIYFGTPDEGYFMTTAEKITGPWTPLHAVLREAGWDDCCPFWDDDGQGYLVGSNFRDGYKIHLWKLSPDGCDLIRESDRVIHQSKGSEANKLYKFNGLYYHLFSEVKSEGRVVMMERATNIFGPYNEVKQLNHADKEAKEPNQGGLVQTEQGGWYWFTHHGSGSWEGRCASLLPVTWIDGWPIIGKVGADGIGSMVWSGKNPLADTVKVTPQTSDEFVETNLPPQWEWNYQPRAEKWSLAERPGWLRLRAFTPVRTGGFFKSGNTLTQRVMGSKGGEVVLKMDVSGMADGQTAGLCVFWRPVALLGVVQRNGVRKIQLSDNGTNTSGAEVKTADVWLKAVIDDQAICTFAYSLDGKRFDALGGRFKLGWANYRGSRMGIYCWNDDGENGSVDVDSFRYDYAGTDQRKLR